MDSEELEALEEEEKLIQDMVKKGTMQKAQDVEDDKAQKDMGK